MLRPSKRDCGHVSDVGLSCNCGKMWCPECYDDHVCPRPLPPLWPSQERGLQAIRDAFTQGRRRILVTAPTGGGKTRLIAEIARGADAKGRRAIVYSHRRMLVSQTSRKLAEAGVGGHGKMLSGERTHLLRDLQVASIQTAYSWLKRDKMDDVHPGDVVIVDEPHAFRGESLKTLIDRHVRQGALIVGFTATPIGLSDWYDVLVEAGTKKELRDIGALVPARTFAPDEPDLKHIGREKEHYTQQEQAESLGLHEEQRRVQIFGRVWDNWTRLQKDLFGVFDPGRDARPTVLFAPGVPHSRWFAEGFRQRGVSAAHLEARTPDGERQEIMEGSRDGTIKVVCNRFVLREGIDWPWLEHGVFACVMGSLQTWLQSAGRLLRAFPDTGKQFAVIQEHGGMFWRLGDVNDDIEWRLEDSETKLRKKRQSQPVEKEPLVCPKCRETIKPYEMQLSGGSCPHCGHRFKLSMRSVVQVDGTLKRVYGPARPRRRRHRVKMDAEAIWDTCFFMSMRAKRQYMLSQVLIWFDRECQRQGLEGEHPPYGAWNCPEKGSADWLRYAREVYPKYAKR